MSEISDGLGQIVTGSDGFIMLNGPRLCRNFKHLCRVVTGSDGILHYSPLRARDRVNVQTRHLPSLPSLAFAA